MRNGRLFISSSYQLGNNSVRNYTFLHIALFANFSPFCALQSSFNQTNVNIRCHNISY